MRKKLIRQEITEEQKILTMELSTAILKGIISISQKDIYKNLDLNIYTNIVINSLFMVIGDFLIQLSEYEDKGDNELIRIKNVLQEIYDLFHRKIIGECDQCKEH